MCHISRAMCHLLCHHVCRHLSPCASLSQADLIPESTEYLWMAMITSVLLTCLPIVFRAHVYWTHVEQLHVSDLSLQNLTHLLQASPHLLGTNWRFVGRTSVT